MNLSRTLEPADRPDEARQQQAAIEADRRHRALPDALERLRNLAARSES